MAGNHTHKYLLAQEKIKQAVDLLDIDDRLPGERVLAKDLGISYMTVRKAIENLVEEGVLYKVPKKGCYVADPKLKRKKTIGYFLDSSIEEGVTSPYYSLIFDALEKQAAKQGNALIYFSESNEGDLSSETLKVIEKLDGVIMSCFPRIESIVHKIKEQVPVVCIDNRSLDESVPSLTLDNFTAVVDSINYFLSLGHKRIGFITGLDDSDVGRNRLAGYISALKSHGLDEDEGLIYKGDYSFETGKRGANYFMSMKTSPTAIMCANDTMAIGSIKEICRKGLSVPNDISVIGFDDISVSSHIMPALTTISVPVQEIAKQAIEMLTRLLDGEEPENRHLTLPCQLVLRESCAENDNGNTATSNLAG